MQSNPLPVVESAQMNDQGRVVIPAAIRREMGLDGPTELVFRLEGDKVTIETIEEAVASVQRIVAQYVESDGSQVDDFIAERRAQAAHE